MGFLRSVVGVVVGSLVIACAPAGRPNTVFSLAAESGARCPAGGTRLEAGPDTNGNGTLDNDEVATAQYICNGAAGAPGAVGQAGTEGTSVLVRLESEPSGANCPEGGTRVLAGPDANHDGVLGSSEVATTSFVCDGVRGPGITWVTVNGTSAQALPNTGYVANNPSARAVITLPTNPAVGDLVQVTGAGDGGWSLAQGPNQRVDARHAGLPIGMKWTSRGGDGGTPDLQNWTSVVSSADGSRLVAMGPRSIYISADNGHSWSGGQTTAVGLPALLEYAKIASSANGQRLVISTGSFSTGQIWLSSNGGSTWAAPSLSSGLPTTARWFAVASSADGLKIVAAAIGGQIWTSANGGATWVARTTGLPTTYITWTALTSSADGSRLVAAGDGKIYFSMDSGQTWSPPGPASGLPPVITAEFLASSSDGLRLVAGGRGGRLWTSASGGASWEARDGFRAWNAVASSSDGKHLLAASSGLTFPNGSGGYTLEAYDQLYFSSDFGVTWVARGARNSWAGCAISADGSRLAAAASGTPVDTSALDSTPGPGGGLSGERGSAVTLQYIGDDTFLVLRATGADFEVW